MATFPLLPLPSVALSEVLRSMKIRDLLELAQISRKIWTQIHILYGVKLFKIQVNVNSQNATVTITSGTDSYEFQVHEMHAARSPLFPRYYNNSLVPVKLSQGITTTYYDDILHGLISILAHLTDLFKCTINHIGISNLSKSHLLTLADGLAGQNLELEVLNMYIIYRSCANILMNNMKITKKLWISEPPSGPEEVYTLLAYPKEIYICHSPWFTREMLFESDCQQMLLCHSLLKNEDLDGFVKKWRSGDFPNLKHIMVKSTGIDRKSEIDGKWVPIVNRGVQESQIIKISSEQVDLGDGVEIFSDSGRRGTLQVKIHGCDPWMFSLYVHD